MNTTKQFRFILLVVLAALLAGALAPAAVAGRGSLADTNLYLPIVLKQDTSASGDTLDNGGTVTGLDGVGIGALSGALAEPIQVSITAASPPALALPVPAQLLGGFYRVGAGKDVFAQPDSAFILALPIPAGANTTNLALAVLESGAYIYDGDPLAEDWAFLEGMVDADEGLFLTTILGLPQAGLVFALVQHPDLESPPNDGLGSAPQVSSRSAVASNFRVKCIGFPVVGSCTIATELEWAGILDWLYERFQTVHGFPKPRLQFWHGSIFFIPRSLGNNGYTVYMAPTHTRLCQGRELYYNVILGRLIICYDKDTEIPTNLYDTVVFGYFYATAYGYLEVLADYFDQSEEPWVMAGMATSAIWSMVWDDKMVRFERLDVPGLRLVDIPLEYYGGPLEFDEFYAQDFWVYYGQRDGLNLTYLKSVLERGSTTQAVVDVLGDGDYLEPYWDWAKNQVMEAQVDLDGELETPCQLETDAVALLEEVSFGGYSNTFYDVLLDPLTSIVVDLRWDRAGYNFFYGWVFPAPMTGQDPAAAAEAMRFKFYEDREDGCAAVPDDSRTFYNPDPNKRYYLVISNTDHDNDYQYRIGFEYSPYQP